VSQKRNCIVALLLSLAFIATVAVAGDLDSFIRSLNIRAQADSGGFKAEISARFGVPIAQVDAVMASVESPADAYMVFRVGQLAEQPIQVVVNEYTQNRGKGWGVIAKNLGIKPGSAEFHALKEGYGNQEGSSRGKGKGKKGH
jgi:hypothetical protein